MKFSKNRLGKIEQVLESRLLLAGAASPVDAEASQELANLPDQNGLENVASTDSAIEPTALPTAVAGAETSQGTNLDELVSDDSQGADFSAVTAREIGDTLAEELPRASFVFNEAIQLANQFALARDAVQEDGLDSVFTSGTDARSGFEFSLLQSERFIAESSLLTQGTLRSLDAAGESFGLLPIQFSQDEPVDLTLPVPDADGAAGDGAAAASADLPTAASGLGPQTNDGTPVELAATESVDAEAVPSVDDTSSPLPTELPPVDSAFTSGSSDQSISVPTENLATGAPVAEQPSSVQFADDLAATESVDAEAVPSVDDTSSPLPTELPPVDSAFTSGPSDQSTSVPTENLVTGAPVAEQPGSVQFADDLAATESVDAEAVPSVDDASSPLPTELPPVDSAFTSGPSDQSTSVPTENLATGAPVAEQPSSVQFADDLAATESVDTEAVPSVEDASSPLPTELPPVDGAFTSGSSDQSTSVPTENLATGAPVAEQPSSVQFADDLAATESVDAEAVPSVDDTSSPLPTEVATDAEPAAVAASESPLSFESINDDFQTGANAIANSNLVFTSWAEDIGMTVQSLLNFDPSVGDAGQADALFETFTTQLDAFLNVVSAANEDFGAAADITAGLSQAVEPLDFENPIPLDLDGDLNAQIDGALGQEASVFSVEIPTADEFTFFAESDDFDPVLSLFDENETLIVENDDLDPTEAERADQEFSEINSRIVAPLEPGNLFVTVEGFSDSDIGDFRLSVGPNAAGLPITAAIGDSDQVGPDNVDAVGSLAAAPSDNALIAEEALQVDA